MLLTKNTHNSGCKLIGSVFEDGVQLLLGIFAFMTLLIKWRCEKPNLRRDVKIFLLDGSKQGISSLFAHGANMLIAMGLSDIVVDTDQCAWYFVSYFLDTILGVGLAYLLLQYLTYIANKKNWEMLMESGDYGISGDNNKILKYWGVQLISWIGIICVSRLFTGIVLLIFRGGFANIANGIASLFSNNPKMLLVFVMVICPGIMNLIQVWIQDNILKKKVNREGILDRQLLNNMDSDGIGDDQL
jgi:hypothetical protein